MSRRLGPRQQAALDAIRADDGRLVVMNSWRGSVWASVPCPDPAGQCRWCAGSGIIRLWTKDIEALLARLPLHEEDRGPSSTTYRLAAAR